MIIVLGGGLQGGGVVPERARLVLDALAAEGVEGFLSLPFVFAGMFAGRLVAVLVEGVGKLVVWIVLVVRVHVLGLLAQFGEA